MAPEPLQDVAAPAAGSVRIAAAGRWHLVERPALGRNLLAWLREDLGRTGTKEGCAEGDCGACCVLIASRSADGGRHCAPVNSCLQPLAALDGRQVLTVEDLVAADGTPGSLQQAFVDAHASQCGFCTPGLLMASAGLLCRPQSPAADEVVAGLSGNLCRCTGYQPIVQAVLGFAATGRAAVEPALSLQLPDRPPAPSEPQRWSDAQGRTVAVPRTAADLDRLLFQRPDSVLVAGATDLGVGFNKRFDAPSHALVIGDIAELQGIVAREDRIEVGALTTWRTLEEQLPRWFPELREMLRRFAAPPVRSVATLGGNIATQSPVGDAMPLLVALDARLVLRSARGERSVAAEEFPTGYRQTQLQAGEYIARVVLPLIDRRRTRLRFDKLSKRYDQDIASLSAGMLITYDAAGRLATVRIAFGGMAATVRRASACEAALLGERPTPARLLAAAAALERDFAPRNDMRGSARYRLEAAKGVLLRFFRPAAAQAGDPRAVQGVRDPSLAAALAAESIAMAEPTDAA